ncbi:hypothetical protein BKA61DRAFT_662518 [Leptodontidium sp. MPI-SDFR-AT-0119]|nr:hypothetical protein BKA61DRAFT_662518 [Leptodontidium sp. MPI-SDFR-AT-0119]
MRGAQDARGEGGKNKGSVGNGKESWKESEKESKKESKKKIEKDATSLREQSELTPLPGAGSTAVSASGQAHQHPQRHPTGLVSTQQPGFTEARSGLEAAADRAHPDSHLHSPPQASAAVQVRVLAEWELSTDEFGIQSPAELELPRGNGCATSRHNGQIRVCSGRNGVESSFGKQPGTERNGMRFVEAGWNTSSSPRSVERDEIDQSSAPELDDTDQNFEVNIFIAHPPIGRPAHHSTRDDLRGGCCSPRSSRTEVRSDLTQFTYDCFAFDPDLSFEDLGHIIVQEENPIPDIEDLEAHAELYEAVRASMDRPLKTHSSTSALIPNELLDLFTRTNIRISDGNPALKLHNTEQAVSKTISTVYKWAKEKRNVKLCRLNPSQISRNLINQELCQYFYDDSIELFDERVTELKFHCPYDEARFRADFWDALVFVQGRGRAVIEREGESVMRIVELRTKTVSKCALSGKTKKDRSRPQPLYPDGVLTYYPFRLHSPAESSIQQSDMPPLVLKRANAYIYFDIAYVILANPLLELYTASGRLESLFRLPVNRLFVKLDPRGNLCSTFTYLPHILIEVQPLSAKDNAGDDLRLKAFAYLVLNSAALLHDYMKLLWLAAPRGEKFFKAQTPYIYLITAVGFRAEIHCAHIRKHDSQSQDESFDEVKTHQAPALDEGSAIPSLIRYETVFIGTYDLKNVDERGTFADKYFDIQCMAHLRAAQHGEVMKAAMESTRNIGLTELSDLAFVHTVQEGEVMYGMVDEGGNLVWEGEGNEVGVMGMDNGVVLGGLNEEGWCVEMLPMPEKEDLDLELELNGDRDVDIDSSYGVSSFKETATHHSVEVESSEENEDTQNLRYPKPAPTLSLPPLSSHHEAETEIGTRARRNSTLAARKQKQRKNLPQAVKLTSTRALTRTRLPRTTNASAKQKLGDNIDIKTRSTDASAGVNARTLGRVVKSDSANINPKDADPSANVDVTHDDVFAEDWYNGNGWIDDIEAEGKEENVTIMMTETLKLRSSNYCHPGLRPLGVSTRQGRGKAKGKDEGASVKQVAGAEKKKRQIRTETEGSIGFSKLGEGRKRVCGRGK